MDKNYLGSFELRALKYFNDGNNCSESVLKAAEDVYGLPAGDEITDMCSVLSNGMGIGCFCGAVMVGLMVLGRMFEPVTSKRLRIRLLWEFNGRFSDFNCQALKSGSGGCSEAMRYVCRLVDELIAEEKK